MSSTAPRRRASTLKDMGPDAAELQCQLQILGEIGLVDEDDGRTEGMHAKLESAHRIRQSLLETHSTLPIRDTFRHLNGFQTVMTILDGIAHMHGESGGKKDEKLTIVKSLLQALFAVLTAALQSHKGNQKYFRQRVGEGGWLAAEQILRTMLTGGKGSADIGMRPLTDKVFGCLLACALDDESMTDYFHTLRRHGTTSNDSSLSSLISFSINSTSTPAPSSERGSGDSSLQSAAPISKLIQKDFSPSAIVYNPDAVLVMFKLWTMLELRLVEGVGSIDKDTLPPRVPSLIHDLASLSTANLVALHGTGLLNEVLTLLVKLPSKDNLHVHELHGLATTLLKLGVASANDSYFLYQHAHSSALVGELLLMSLRSSRSPSYVHFDLSLYGYASIELPGIGQGFPPTSSSSGYTLSFWFQVIRFDSNSHTTIFGAFDASQTCFVLVYLEKDTHNLILQTSVTSSKPSVRFKSSNFRERRWYNVVIAHRRPKLTSSARASLFIDGEFVEQVKSQYPTIPPPAKGNLEERETPYSNCKTNAIQAFLGTPQDLASRLGNGLVFTQWRLASANVFADVLSDDLISVYYELGPRYTGNYQDCLGSFQTYRASAVLNLRNESLHPGKEEKSDILAAIRSKAAALLPESKILLNISATLVLDDDQKTFDGTQVLKFLSKTAAKNLRSVTRGGRGALAINGAIPSINEALLHPSGFAVLTGDPTVVIPQSLDNAAWQIGGCVPVGLALLEASRTADEFLRALKILLESVQENWRNSEAMERENGFGVLSSLLNTKLGQSTSETVLVPRLPKLLTTDQSPTVDLPLTVLVEILKFVGYRTDKPEDSVIINPLAYRILLVDTVFWREAKSRVQELYYEQFIIFGARSKFQQFNAKRLSRMRIIKKWLDSLQGGTLTAETFDYFIQAFKSVLTRNITAESMRALALYVTYAIHKPRSTSSTPARVKSMKLSNDLATRRKTLGSSSPRAAIEQIEATPKLTQLQIALRILELYADLLCLRDDSSNIKKFARTVTNKWLLHLLADDEPSVVVLAAKILARLLVVSGRGYVQKFVEKTGGATVIRHRLKRWWNIPNVWLICFAVLFGLDVANIDFARKFNLSNFIDTFVSGDKMMVVYPAMLPVITAMLDEGLKVVNRDQSEINLSSREDGKERLQHWRGVSTTSRHSRQRSMTLATETSAPGNPKLGVEQLTDSMYILRTVIRFMADIHMRSQSFRDFAVSSPYTQGLLFVLFPNIVGADPISPDMELHFRESAVDFKGDGVITRPLSATSTQSVPGFGKLTAKSSQGSMSSRTQPRIRNSSYVLVTSGSLQVGASEEEPRPVILSKNTKTTSNISSSITDELFELIVVIFADQIFSRPDFLGLGLFMKVPPGVQEHQAHFETFILRNTLSRLGSSIALDRELLLKPRVLANLARLAAHLGEAIYEGWFINGAEDTLEFLGNILEYLQLPEVSLIKAVALCSPTVASIRAILARVILLRLSELDGISSSTDTIAFLGKLVYWQSVLLPTEDRQEAFLQLLCFLVYNKLRSPIDEVRMAAADLWRMLFVQKPKEISVILMQASTADNASLTKEFKNILELDNEAFLSWMDDNRSDLDSLLYSTLSKPWENFVREETQKIEETAKARINKRREKLKVWALANAADDEILRRHETGTDHWRSNIYAAEHLKRQRALQDYQDSQVFNGSTWVKMNRELRRPCGVFEDSSVQKWQLDQTEGRNRMRMRLIADKNAHLYDYQPKRKQSQISAKRQSSISSRTKALSTDVPPFPTQSTTIEESADDQDAPLSNSVKVSRPLSDDIDGAEPEDDFEIVDDPREEAEEYEDKNRKVVRSLQRGEKVEHVHNVSRIVGLEAIEGLLILGNAYLYLLDNLFQRSDGEVVNVGQAPTEERDPYLQIISGREASNRESTPTKTNCETRSWRWDDVLSISKRRFLFRDVAIEAFFVDGRSYLLTAGSPPLRDQLYQRLLEKASGATDRATAAIGEDCWRIESVRNPGDETQTLGSKFASVFAQHNASPATKKWVKGEISNFHYLMLVNTMAGRTFNDLTQYPVFPWVLADYTSEELDLSNPRSFRDLSKPMGCQTPARQAYFRDRYQAFADIGQPPHHYGTHYSSAMTVASYLIRLQPFVHSYLLLQGGSFDHPDRLFYSIGKTWSSASRDNSADVRELIPEFYYLPEFLLNQNDYEFGTRQGDGGTVNTVELPPWAKGDPKIFIARHREALESEYVSQHLHQWIDLVFGHKQRGEAALEATNVFNHLSYHGAVDLDTIANLTDRAVAIDTIHNFGQTPHQVFQRPHPSREEAKNKVRRLDTGAEGLTRLPFPLLEANDRIAFLQYSAKHDRLLCSGPFRLNIAPAYDKYMEWGFIDGSVRFFAADSKKQIGLFEHVHQGQLSHVLFADSKTLVTAGSDCTISVWGLIVTPNAVDLLPKTCLFGHKSAVTMLAVSRSFSALMSASSDGQVLLWDLNRSEFVRHLTTGKPVECARINDVTGVIMLCRGSEVSLWTLNGDPILEQNVCVEGDNTVSSCAFYEGSGNEYLVRDLIFTGHTKGVVNVWNTTISKGNFVLEHVKRMHHLDHAGYNIGATITSILPMAQKVYTGDDDGKVYEWDCIQRQ